MCLHNKDIAVILRSKFKEPCLRRVTFQNLVFTLLALLLCCVQPVFADNDPLESLGFIEKPQEQLVSSFRSPRPSSKIAENVSVITAADISRLNAHTLAEVLQNVPGIQLDYLRTPSTFTYFNIQGALNTTVLVLIDGIRQNDFDQNFAQPGLIPVQQIERIEIIKGAASTAWGSALGGVINIITKSPDPERTFSGMVSGSTGSRFTADSRTELSGTLGRFGYYLTAGNLRSDGLSPNTATNLNNLYGKLSYNLPGNGTATFGLSYLTARPGLDEADTTAWGFVHDNNEHRRTNGFIKLSQPLGSNLSLDIDAYVTNRDDHTKYGGRDAQGAIVFFNDYAVRETGRGTNARFFWGDAQRNLAAGFEYAHGQASWTDLLTSPIPGYDRIWDRWALYANGAYSVGDLTILPGVRYDLTGISGEYTSYTLGVTYQLTEKTTLRAYAAQGFSMPYARADNMLQKVKTVQAGFESGALPYLWLKGTWFFNALRNSQSTGTVTTTSQNRHGFELETRSTPAYGLWLSSGYTFLYAKDTDTGARLQTGSQYNVPPHTVKLALNYDLPGQGVRATLAGNYIWWNAAPGTLARDTGMIWDLHLNWKLRDAFGVTPELFFTGHNLFNGVQTTDTELYSNASRWFEGGVRFAF